MKNIRYAVGVLLLLTVFASGCTAPVLAEKPDLSSRPIKGVTTVGMITDIVQQVGGERVQVTGLMGPGVDPHLYKASEGDVLRLGTADVIFYDGLHLEAKLAEVLERLGGRVRTVAVTDYIDRSLLQKPAQFEGQYDPHVWFDVTLWMKAVERVRDTLIEMDPDSADLYRTNATAYLSKLEDLHRYVKEQAARVPAEQRVLVTAHDAFNYFGIGGELFSDAMGSAGTVEGTYIGMVRHNIDKTVKALLGD